MWLIPTVRVSKKCYGNASTAVTGFSITNHPKCWIFARFRYQQDWKNNPSFAPGEISQSNTNTIEKND
jgi:hypothetical protein